MSSCVILKAVSCANWLVRMGDGAEMSRNEGEAASQKLQSCRENMN